MMRAEPAAAEQKILNSPATDDVPTTIQSFEQAAIVSAPAEPETPDAGPDKLAALTEVATPAENSFSSGDMPKLDASTPEFTVRAKSPADAPSSAAETTVAAIAEMTLAAPNQSAATAADRTNAPIEDSTRIAETKIATLGGPPVTIETNTPSKVTPTAVKKPAQARRIVKRRRIAQRARVTPAAPLQPANPFGS